MRRATIALAAVLLLAACGTGGPGTLGGILGSANPSTPSSVGATVNYVDTNAQRIDVNVYDVNQLKTSSNGQSVYYDSHTQVVYQGQNYRPTDLERGDQIAVQGHNNNGHYLADTITVTRNVRTRA
jgi:hypothetical protein